MTTPIQNSVVGTIDLASSTPTKLSALLPNTASNVGNNRILKDVVIKHRSGSGAMYVYTQTGTKAPTVGTLDNRIPIVAGEEEYFAQLDTQSTYLASENSDSLAIINATPAGN